MSLKTNDIFFKIFIAVFLIIAFYLTILGSYDGYETHNGWKIGDWLINYQGGFIRRGFLGELVYHISYYLNTNPGIIIFYLQVGFYFIFFLFAYLSLLKIQSLKIYWLLIFSPFLFYFQVLDVQGGFRKEIIFFALLAFVVWTSNRFNEEKFEKIFFSILLLYPFVILTHEMLAIFFPYLFIVYLFKVPLNPKRVKYLLLLLSLSVFMVVLSVMYHGDATNIAAIVHSLDAVGYKPNGGAINWLDKNLEFALNGVETNILHKNYKVWFSTIMLLSLLPFIPILPQYRILIKNKIILFLLIMVAIGSIVLFMTALDWGRFIYINLVSLFLISLVIREETKQIQHKCSTVFIFILSIIYFSIWHIPHCCLGQPIIPNVDSNNIEVLIKRVSQ